MNRELDALVAEKVMDLDVHHRAPEHFTRDDGSEGIAPEVWWITGGGLPAYSTDIAAAWLVVEKMREKGWRFHLSEHGSQIWNARFTPEDTSKYCYDVSTAPTLAICRAALAALARPAA